MGCLPAHSTPALVTLWPQWPGLPDPAPRRYTAQWRDAPDGGIHLAQAARELLELLTASGEGTPA